MEQAPPDLAASKPQHGKSSCKGFLLPVADTKIYSKRRPSSKRAVAGSMLAL